MTIFIEKLSVEKLQGIPFPEAKDSLMNNFVSLEVKELLVQKVIPAKESDQEIKEFLSSYKGEISPKMREVLIKKIISFSVGEVLSFSIKEDQDLAYSSIETMLEISYDDEVRAILINSKEADFEGLRYGISKRIITKNIIELKKILIDEDIPLRYRQEIAVKGDYSALSAEEFQRFTDEVEEVDFDALRFVENPKKSA